MDIPQPLSTTTWAGYRTLKWGKRALYLAVVFSTGVVAFADFFGDYATTLAIGPDGRTAAIGTFEGKVRLLEIASEGAFTQIDVGCAAMAKMAIGLDTLWIVDAEGMLFAIDLRDRGIRRFTHRLHGAATYLKETNDRLFIGIESDLYAVPLNADVGESFERVASGGMSAVACPDATHVYWSDFGPQIHAIELNSGKSETYFTGLDCQPNAIDVNSRGQAAVGCEDGCVRFFQRLGEGALWTSPDDSTNSDAVVAISISQHGETILSCDLSGEIRLIDAADGATRFRTRTSYPLAIDFAASEDHRRAIVIAQHHRLPWRRINIYDLETQQGRSYDARYPNSWVFWTSLFTAICSGMLLILASFFERCARRRRLLVAACG